MGQFTHMNPQVTGAVLWLVLFYEWGRGVVYAWEWEARDRVGTKQGSGGEGPTL